MKRIYQYCESVLNKVTPKFKESTTYQRYDESVPGSVGILLYSSRADDVALSGEVESESLKVELHIVCKNDESDIFDNLQILRDFVDEFELCNDLVDGLDIFWAEHLGSKAYPTYINGYGLQVCKCIIDFNYLYI